MKKKLYCIVCLYSLISIILFACGKSEKPIVLPDTEKFDSADNTSENVIFQATVMEATSDSVVIKPLEGSAELNSADEFRIPNKEQMELQIGALVEITYNGEILETYPAQLGEVYKIALVEQTEIPMEAKEPSVVKTYEVTDSDTAFEDDELVTIVKYYEMSDGTWKTDTHTYQYRLEITGRMGGAQKDSTFVFLSNIENITFEQAWKASGFSSNTNDYFKEEDAKFVALK